MLRNLLISAGALLIGLSMADSAAAQETPFDGLYIGGQGHYSYIDVDVSVSGVGSRRILRIGRLGMATGSGFRPFSHSSLLVKC